MTGRVLRPDSGDFTGARVRKDSQAAHDTRPPYCASDHNRASFKYDKCTKIVVSMSTGERRGLIYFYFRAGVRESEEGGSAQTGEGAAAGPGEAAPTDPSLTCTVP